MGVELVFPGLINGAARELANSCLHSEFWVLAGKYRDRAQAKHLVIN